MEGNKGSDIDLGKFLKLLERSYITRFCQALRYHGGIKKPSWCREIQKCAPPLPHALSTKVDQISPTLSIRFKILYEQKKWFCCQKISICYMNFFSLDELNIYLLAFSNKKKNYLKEQQSLVANYSTIIKKQCVNNSAETQS